MLNGGSPSQRPHAVTLLTWQIQALETATLRGQKPDEGSAGAAPVAGSLRGRTKECPGGLYPDCSVGMRLYMGAETHKTLHPKMSCFLYKNFFN